MALVRAYRELYTPDEPAFEWEVELLFGRDPRHLYEIVRAECVTPRAVAAAFLLYDNAQPRTTLSYHEYLKSKQWQEIRRVKINNAWHQCEWCGSRDQLEVHHLTYERLGYERMRDLLVLCHNCHAAHHGKDA